MIAVPCGRFDSQIVFPKQRSALFRNENILSVPISRLVPARTGEFEAQGEALIHLLNTFASDDETAHQQLLQTVYGELKKIARGKMAHERSGHTLQATALVHEAWLRLEPNQERIWKNRAHFFGAAGEAMRRILVENARKRLAVKRGGGFERVDIQEIEIPIAAQKEDDDILAIHEALDRFAVSYPDMAELVKLRYFVGMTLEEAGQALEVTGRTAKRWWAFARAWLKAETKR